MTPKIAVCITTYCRAKLLREAIQSVLDQSSKEVVVFVSDNASADNTPEVVSSFHDSRLVYSRHPHNIGMTRNTQAVLLQAAQSPDVEYVALLADDDLYLPDHLKKAVTALDAHPQAAYFNCPALVFGNGASGEMRLFPVPDSQSPLLYFSPRDAVKLIGIIAGLGSSLVIRKCALQKDIFWGKPDFLPFDLLAFTQLMAYGGFVFSREPTVRYRYHESNISGYTKRNYFYQTKLANMRAFAARYLAEFLMNKDLCTVADIEAHSRTAAADQVVTQVMGFSSFDSTRELRALARRIFETRTDIDVISERFRLARRMGFPLFPISERISQIATRWRP